ncbi:MAG: ABC transporter, partial [Cyanobacteriota bacterium]|nr:ABC transporter [Cyanobacteriota bacterium]
QLAPCRQVRLELAEPPVPQDLAPYGEIETLEGRSAQLLVPRERLTTVVAELLARFEVLDLEVNDPPIDELIGRLYHQGAAPAAAVPG